jgi:hypothetical protein
VTRYLRKMRREQEPSITTSEPLQSTEQPAGEPLPEEVRAFMEPRFGHDFGQVRIHADEQAAQTAQALNARAYTIGQEIFFGPGAYAPQSEAGRRLLAHELTHTLQQQGASGGVEGVSERGESSEQEARRMAQEVVAAREPVGAPRAVSRLGAPLVQRDDLPPVAQTQGTGLFQSTPPNILDLRGVAAQVVEEERNGVRKWLDQNKTRVSQMPEEQVIVQVRQNVPRGEAIGDALIKVYVEEWARENKIAFPALQNVPQGQIATAALSALSLANEGVTVISSPVEVKIGISGATASLKAGDVDLGASIGLSRKIELSATYGHFKFDVTLAADKWSLTLSYGTEDVPDLDGLAKTFKEGEQSLRRIVSDPAKLADPEHASNVKESLESISNIIKSVPQRIEVSVGSADSGAGGPAAPKGGWQVMAKVTILRF